MCLNVSDVSKCQRTAAGALSPAQRQWQNEMSVCIRVSRCLDCHGTGKVVPKDREVKRRREVCEWGTSV